MNYSFFFDNIYDYYGIGGDYSYLFNNQLTRKMIEKYFPKFLKTLNKDFIGDSQDRIEFRDYLLSINILPKKPQNVSYEEKKNFVDYMYSFYGGENPMYDFFKGKLTKKILWDNLDKFLSYYTIDEGRTFANDSIDREIYRDYLLEIMFPNTTSKNESISSRSFIEREVTFEINPDKTYKLKFGGGTPDNHINPKVKIREMISDMNEYISDHLDTNEFYVIRVNKLSGGVRIEVSLEDRSVNHNELIGSKIFQYHKYMR